MRVHSASPSKRSKLARSQKLGPRAKSDFLIVAIGASAGGVEANTELVRNLPPDTGMAFVVIQHLDPNLPSVLTELLSKETRMRVVEVENGMKVESNRIFVIPPNASMFISDHTLHLAPRGDSRAGQTPIDRFMRSLAEAQGSRGIGVILSGSGTDGTLGMSDIQAHGGVTFAQNERSAKYDGMPRSAIAAGCVNYVLPPISIARALARIARHPHIAQDRIDEGQFASDGDAGLDTIFESLKEATGVDFTHYGQTTILRRIQRRMTIQKLDKLKDYVKHIHENPAEIGALYEDILIDVTSFFRNPQVFEAMKKHVFPKILKNRDSASTVRIWTPGCASGQETYSVAMAMVEVLGTERAQPAIQLFGTDVSESNVTKARVGFYLENIRDDVSPERLRRFFTKVEGGYRISKNIRDICVFARHNLLNDPPFSQMDLICCRNLLIYLEPALQNKVISLFHYATRPGGFLVLGTSEGISSAHLFAPEDNAHKIFSRTATTVRQLATFSLRRRAERGEYAGPQHPSGHRDANWNYAEALKEFDRQLLARCAPAAVFLNEDLEILHTRGNVNRYLKLAPGRASLSILKMAREGLLMDLRNALGRARKEDVRIRKQNVEVKNGNADGNARESDGSRSPARSIRVNFDVIPVNVGNPKELYFMVLFEDASSELRARLRGEKPKRETESIKSRIDQLEQELSSTKEYLQSVIDTHEATNEELQSANEEILSSNEELQSTNEELETAKEELQSANEELTTVNDELRSRNVEVTHVNNDLTNILTNIDIAVVMIGSDLTIRRMTPKAQEILGLIPGDIGRPLLNINPAIEIPDFQATVAQVMSDLRVIEKEFTDSKSARYLLRVLPCRTGDNRSGGAVMNIQEAVPREIGRSAP